MTTLADIIPPHSVKDESHLASLVAAYESGAAVPPIVVLRRRDRDALGVTGSHRLAAMRSVYDDTAPLADDDSDVLFVDCDEDERLRRVYDRVRDAYAANQTVNAADDLAYELPGGHPALAALAGQ